MNAILLGTPSEREIVLPGPHPHPETTVIRLADGSQPPVRTEDGAVRINLSAPLPEDAAHAFQITPATADHQREKYR